jgi:hypothetical protein
MKVKKERMENNLVPILFPLEPAEFWVEIRRIIQREISRAQKVSSSVPLMETPGLTQKPLYKISEICTLFHDSRLIVYEWVKQGKLRRIKKESRVYFLETDIQQLLQ